MQTVTNQRGDDVSPEDNKQEIDIGEPMKPTFPDNTITYDGIDVKTTIEDTLK